MFDKDYTNNYTTILEKNQHKILGRVERDKASLRLSALIAVQIPDGRISEDVVIQKSRLLNHGIKELDWIAGYEGTFNDDDLKVIKRKIEKLLIKIPKDILETSDRATSAEVFEKLVEFIKEHAGELISPDGITILPPDCFLGKNKVYIRTTVFNSFLTENKGLEWKRIEVLKMLKRKELLEVGNGRTYDKKIKINGRCQNYYVIKIVQDKKGALLMENDADETININTIKEKNE